MTLTHSGRWRWRWATMCLVLAQLASLCTGLPLVTTKTSTPTPTPTPTANETEMTDTPTPTPTASNETEAPESTMAAPAVATVNPSTTEAAASTTFVCTAEQLDTLAKLSDSNAYLQTTCSSDGGYAGYVFPVNGVLSYAQMIAMGGSEACQIYFLAVLVVEATECEVADVYVRSTAETILALALQAGSYPTESEVSAAIAARAAEYTSSPSAAASLSWTMPSANELQQQLEKDLLINGDLQIVGTAYSGSDDGDESSDQQESSASLSPASTAVATGDSVHLGPSRGSMASIAVAAAATLLALA